MGSHAPSEDVDDDKEFVAEALENDALMAHFLMSIYQSEKFTAWRQFQRPTPPRIWGGKAHRSRMITMEGKLAAETEEGASPKTPLSWSGGSWTSGSVCRGVGRPAPSRPPRWRKRASLVEVGKEARRPTGSPLAEAELPGKLELSEDRAPAPKLMKVEFADGEPHALLVAPVFGSCSGSALNKVVAPASAVVAEPPCPSARVEPVRLRLTGPGLTPVIRRPGKKKTLPELKALTESLLREQVELKKELEDLKKGVETVLQENVKLKSLESSLVPSECEQSQHTDQQPCSDPGTAKAQVTEQHRIDQLQRASPSASGPRRAMLWDLNLPPGSDL